MRLCEVGLLWDELTDGFLAGFEAAMGAALPDALSSARRSAFCCFRSTSCRSLRVSSFVFCSAIFLRLLFCLVTSRDLLSTCCCWRWSWAIMRRSDFSVFACTALEDVMKAGMWLEVKGWVEVGGQEGRDWPRWAAVIGRGWSGCSSRRRDSSSAM